MGTHPNSKGPCKGFGAIYDHHSDRNWANFWYPLIMPSLCVATEMIVVSSPIITAAKPDEVTCLSNGISEVLFNDSTVCEEYVYGFENNWTTSTATSQFHLIGDRSSIILDIKSLGLAGFLTSQIWSGFLADRIGRKPTLIICFLFLGITPLLMALCNDKSIYFYSIGTFVMMNGIGNGPIGFQYCIERMAPQYHTLMTMLGLTFFSGIGIMILSLIGYICNSWVQCLIAIGILNLLSIGAVAPIPRSFRWYFSKQKIEEGKQSLKEFCKAANYNYDENQIDEILLHEEKMRVELSMASKNVLKYPKCLAAVCKLSVAWFASAGVYYGIMLSPSPKVLLNNLALGGLSALSSLLFIPLLMWRPERRIILTCSYALVGACILGQGFLMNYPSVGLILGGLAYGIMASAFGLLFLYTSELLPTVIRCSGVGGLSGFSRIGSILGVQVLKLNSPERPWVSSLIFATVAFLAAIATFASPETHGTALTQTLEEAESRFGQTKSTKDEKQPLNM